MDLQFADFIIHRTIAVHHLHLQGIAARRKIGEGNLRTTHRSEEPLIAYSLHAVEETAACRHRHLACSQLDGKGMILVVQVDFTTGIQRLLQHDPALVLLACRQGMIEEHQSAEERTDMRLPDLCHPWTDDIHTIQTTYGNIATMQQTGRAIVELPLLQSVERIVIGHLQVPPSILALLYIDMGNPVFGNQPDVVLPVFDDGTAHGTRRAIQVVDRLHLVGMGIIHGNAGRGSYPEKSATVEHGIVDGRTDERLSAKGMVQVLNLAISEIEDRHILGMPQQRLMGILHEDGADIIGRQLGIAGMIGSKLPGDRIENLETSAQRTYQQAMIGCFGETPHAVAAESAGAGMIGFPHTMGIAGQSAIIGSEIEGAIVHGSTSDYHLGTQSRFRRMETGGLSGAQMIRHDARIIGSAPQNSVPVLRDGTYISYRNGIELGGCRRIIAHAILIGSHPEGIPVIYIDTQERIVGDGSTVVRIV